MRKAANRIALLVAGIAACAGMGELAVRSYRFVRYGGWGGMMSFDSEIGWVVTADYRDRFEKTLFDAAGHPYGALYSTGPHGFRLWGDPAASRPHVVFVGDSFTHAVEVSSEQTYCAELGRDLDVSVFAYGAQGYGTLQEYLVLQRFLDSIRPDLLVWQWCSNDFVNNDYDLELQSVGDNNHSPRPYLNEDGSILLRVPERSRAAAAMRYVGARYSRFVAFLFARVDLYEVARGGDRWVLTREIAEAGRAHPGFRRAAATTGRIVAMARRRWPELPIVALAVDDAVPFLDEFRSIAEACDAELLDGAPAALRLAREQGLVVHAADGGHWSPIGHRVVGQYLARALAARVRSVARRSVASDAAGRADDHLGAAAPSS
jgi:hypothetical protein